tara:strand:+ start:265 stop:867 length:603 start_codon:yes stop_codon:yes gene_type:complete
MKKILGIVLLGLLWSNICLAELPNIFFGIKLGDDIANYNANDCDPCADGAVYSFNTHKVIPNKPHKDYEKYEVRTTPISNKIFEIKIKGSFTYDDFQGDPKTHLFTCKDEQNNLLNALKAKYKTEYPEVFISITEEQLSLLTEERIIDIKLNCKAVDPEPEWKFYKKNGTINSSEFYILAVEESEQLRKKKLEKTDTTGF